MIEGLVQRSVTEAVGLETIYEPEVIFNVKYALWRRTETMLGNVEQELETTE